MTDPEREQQLAEAFADLLDRGATNGSALSEADE
jgi:hypothetical protein